MERLTRIITLFIISLLLVSCGSRVQTERPADRDLSQYNSFAYLPNSNVEVDGMDYNDENVNRTVIDAINQNMQQKGFNLDRENPDLLVLVGVNTRLGQRTTQQPVYAAYPYGGARGSINPLYGSNYYTGYQNWMAGGGILGWTRDTSMYEEGTTIVELVDRKSRETVWRGTLSKDIFGQNDTRAITNMVNNIFAELEVRR